MKPYNIYVTVAYPPDTDTPGLAEENKLKVRRTNRRPACHSHYYMKMKSSVI